MLDLEENLVYIERRRPLWVRILSALLYTAGTFCLVYFFVHLKFSLEEKYAEINFHALMLTAYSYFFAFYTSYTVNCYFNFKEGKFKRQVAIGIFKYGKWKPLPELNYVALFSPDGAVFQINLWYGRNKHWDLYEKYSFDTAFTIAFELSEELNIDLLDSTEPYNFKWVNKEASKAEGKMVYYED